MLQERQRQYHSLTLNPRNLFLLRLTQLLPSSLPSQFTAITQSSRRSRSHPAPRLPATTLPYPPSSVSPHPMLLLSFPHWPPLRSHVPRCPLPPSSKSLLKPPRSLTKRFAPLVPRNM